MERETGVDAGALIWAWAQKRGDYQTAQLALGALYLDKGAQRALRRAFDRFIDLESATDSDRDLLCCVTGRSEDDAIAD